MQLYEKVMSQYKKLRKQSKRYARKQIRKQIQLLSKSSKLHSKRKWFPICQRYEEKLDDIIMWGGKPLHYILVGKTAVAATLREWAAFFECSRQRLLKRTRVEEDVEVSTVFLGMSHKYFDDDGINIFETMIFGGKHNDYQTRCDTFAEALEMHETAIQKAFEV